jgi:hypothetical protein
MLYFCQWYSLVISTYCLDVHYLKDTSNELRINNIKTHFTKTDLSTKKETARDPRNSEDNLQRHEKLQ